MRILELGPQKSQGPLRGKKERCLMNIAKQNLSFIPKISVIIPVYNQEKNIEKCLNSILNQLYKNIEIIVVDDGSTDNTKYIYKKYMNKDTRIKFIYQNRGGVSKARNLGLKNITGEYITFVDADDYIDNDLISNYIKDLEKYKSCILISGYRRIESKKIEYVYKEDFKILNLQESLKILFEDNTYKNYLWNKLYPSNFFKKLNFEEEKTYEDLRIQYKLFELSKNIIICPFVGYNYVYWKNSITNTEKNNLDIIDAHVDRLIYIDRKWNNFTSFLSNKLFRVYMTNCKRFYFTDKKLQNKKKKLNYKINAINNLLYNNLPKIKYIVLKICLKDNIIMNLFISILWRLNNIRKRYPFSRSPVNLI